MNETPSQTVGPYFAIGLPWEGGPHAAAGGITISGTVYDGDGEVIPDAMIETWQSEPAGIRGFARAGTDEDGRFEIVTAKAPYIDVSVFARGLLNRLVTRIYFADEDNGGDPVLATVPEERRATLLAQGDGDGAYRFDIHLQGPGETVFFAL